MPFYLRRITGHVVHVKNKTQLTPLRSRFSFQFSVEGRWGPCRGVIPLLRERRQSGPRTGSHDIFGAVGPDVRHNKRQTAGRPMRLVVSLLLIGQGFKTSGILLVAVGVA